MGTWRASRSLRSASWGTLQPRPFRSAKRVSLKFGSRSWAVGSKGRRMARAFGLGPSSSWAAWACWSSAADSAAWWCCCKNNIKNTIWNRPYKVLIRNTTTAIIPVEVNRSQMLWDRRGSQGSSLLGEGIKDHLGYGRLG